MEMQARDPMCGVLEAGSENEEVPIRWAYFVLSAVHNSRAARWTDQGPEQAESKLEQGAVEPGGGGTRRGAGEATGIC